MEPADQERGKGALVVLLILVAGFVSVIVAGQLALRAAPGWELHASMDSMLDPNRDFLTNRPAGWVEPIDPAILTQPGWIESFLTPGLTVITGTPVSRATPTSSPVPTAATSATPSLTVTASSTNTLIFIPYTPTSSPRPRRTETQPPPTLTPTFTPTVTASATPPLIPTDPPPPEIGTTPDGNVYFLASGSTLTLHMNLIADGDPGFDLVYYERAAPGGGIFLDWVIVEIGDGVNWFPIFYWGNNIADTNSNMDFTILANPQTPPEPDQRAILAAELYNSTGIAIDLDAIAPPGSYSYLRFTAPPGDADNQMEIDAIEVLP